MQHLGSRIAGVFELKLAGRLTFADAPQFPGIIGRVGLEGDDWRIDLSELTYIDSTGMSLFVHIYDAARTAAVSVVICNANGTVDETMRRARFHSLFEFR
ncbi:hypothetical protein CU669_18540 [Paramagnetospirillum kuznetsovii]|uniref:STAS domain-containing protein n=1 Tax=Paramagnetospirillum kuznetsovii TaxID=2053833 RepID=A0A364NTM5_9PROT|nr:STAS domain-containing protein [Paramagnetospirillum kuznetsovii]RAU20449.1 hypothetical protein CU669_18540 [Paramagnetospirillum kuznetsovii]